MLAAASLAAEYAVTLSSTNSFPLAERPVLSEANKPYLFSSFPCEASRLMCVRALRTDSLGTSNCDDDDEVLAMQPTLLEGARRPQGARSSAIAECWSGRRCAQLPSLSARRICVEQARKRETFDKLHRRNQAEKGREKLQDIDPARKHESLN